jgi:hypothetical protein
MTQLNSWNAVVAADAIDRYRVTGSGTSPYFVQTLLEERERRGARHPRRRCRPRPDRRPVLRGDQPGELRRPCVVQFVEAPDHGPAFLGRC